MDAKALINAMIAEYVTRTAETQILCTPVNYRHGWGDALVHAASLAYNLDEVAAREYVGERIEDIRAAQV